MCIRMYMYVCVYVRIYMYIYICVYIYMLVYVRVEKKKKKSLILFLFSSTIVIKSGYFHMVGGFHASDGFSVLMEPPSQIFFYLTLINQYCIMKRLICLCFCTFI